MWPGSLGNAVFTFPPRWSLFIYSHLHAFELLGWRGAGTKRRELTPTRGFDLTTAGLLTLQHRLRRFSPQQLTCPQIFSWGHFLPCQSICHLGSAFCQHVGGAVIWILPSRRDSGLMFATVLRKHTTLGGVVGCPKAFSLLWRYSLPK